MNNIVERLTTEYTISQCFHDVSRILCTIQEYERQLKSLSFQDEYLIDKYWETDGDFRDIDKLLEIYQAAHEHITKLEAEGKSCLFEKITTKAECPASQRGMFIWDDHKDGGAVEDSEAFFCYSYDSYESWHQYGEIFAVMVRYEPENIKQSFPYLSLIEQIKQAKMELRHTLQQLNILGVTFNEQ